MFYSKPVLAQKEIYYSNIYDLRNRLNYMKFTRASHQTMLENGRLGKNGLLVSVLVCEEEEEEGVAKSYS